MHIVNIYITDSSNVVPAILFSSIPLDMPHETVSVKARKWGKT